MVLKKSLFSFTAVMLLSACSGGGESDSGEDTALRAADTDSVTNSVTANATDFDWANDPGGVFNIPSEEFNAEHFGWGSFGFNTSQGIRYNKVDLQRNSGSAASKTMYIDNNQDTLLYDSEGNVIARAWDSAIGWNHVAAERDGGIAAGAISELKIDGVDHKVVYAWSVNSSVGRHSGWVKLTALTPKEDIEIILSGSKNKRDNILTANGANGSGRYEESEIIEGYLPDNRFNYYVTADRDDDNGAGRARYYYTNVDDQYITGLMNIPETGKQRYGVAHNIMPLGTKFYTASYVNSYDLALYPPNSGSPANDIKLTLVFGYSQTNAGEKIYSWINKATLKPTGKTIGGDTTTLVNINKRNASSFSISSGSGGANNQNVYLLGQNKDNANSQWLEINRGGGYYSYQKKDTNFCLDGGTGGANRQNVKLWACNAATQNQHWLKSSTDGGAYKLIKRNAPGFAIDGNSGGVNMRSVALYDSSNPSHNLQWFISPVN